MNDYGLLDSWEYRRGFEDGKKAAAGVQEVVRCKDCKNCDIVDDFEMWCKGRGYPEVLTTPDSRRRL